jgi:SRSO17 transposase
VLSERQPYPEARLLIEWPEGKDEPTKYWLSNPLAEISMNDMVSMAKTRWHIGRDYEELKREFGLGHYEGRGAFTVAGVCALAIPSMPC